MVVRQSLAPAVVGLVGGLMVALALTRVMAGLLFGISAQDPVTFALTPVVLLGAVALASLVPALRASRVEPVTALRDE
jgi:putative ABC transport system permease protein